MILYPSMSSSCLESPSTLTDTNLLLSMSTISGSIKVVLFILLHHPHHLVVKLMKTCLSSALALTNPASYDSQVIPFGLSDGVLASVFLSSPAMAVKIIAKISSAAIVTVGRCFINIPNLFSIVVNLLQRPQVSARLAKQLFEAVQQPKIRFHCVLPGPNIHF